MSSYQEISLHTPSGYETVKVPYTETKKLAADNPVEWRSLYGSDYVQGVNAIEIYRSFAYSCMNVRAEKVATADLKLQQKQASGKMKPIIRHPFYDLMDRPNIFDQTFDDLIKAISINLDLPQGEAFVYYSKNKLGMPDGLYLLPTRNVTVEYNPEKTRIMRYLYTWGTTVTHYYPDEVIHFKLYNPDDPFRGKGTSSAARYALEIDGYQSLYQKNYYLNDAAIGLVFKVPTKMSDESYNRFDTQLKNKHGGPSKAGKHLLWEGAGADSDVFELNATPKESDYKESRQLLKDEICGMFRVPKSILGFVDDVNRANADASNRSFLVNTIIPYSKNIWGKIDRFIKVNYNESFYLEPNYDLEEPREVQLADYTASWRKWRSTNEIREKEGLTPIPEGNDLNQPEVKPEPKEEKNAEQQ